MDLSKLSANERLGAIGAVVAVVGGAIAAGSYPGHWSLAWIGVIAGLALLAIVFLPQLSPKTSLPGSRGSLMLVAGGIGAVVMVLLFLTTINFTFTGFDFSSLMFVLAVAGSVGMLWAAWQEFQAEGGAFRIGMSTTSPASGSTAPAPPPPAAAQEPPRDDGPPVA